MQSSLRTRLLGGVIALVVASAAHADGIIKTLDRKFPTGLYCPLESRAAAGVDLSFVAPAATVRLTFVANNLNASGTWNQLHIDNVTVVDKSVFQAHLLSPSPNFQDCYINSIPPGQTTPGIPNAPSYDFNAAGTSEKLLDLFPTSAAGWTGSHHYFDASRTAPTVPASGTGTSGGSLGLGLEGDGAVVVSASRTVTGLTTGQEYVVHVWWYSAATLPLTIRIERPCPDQDGDGFVACSGSCDLGLGETCGDCNDSSVHCTTSCLDRDSDGWCATTDCDDFASTCTNDCADSDLDLVADCKDTCLDPDQDHYGAAGGGGNACLGADCTETNPYCNASCLDGDGDGHCVPGDCADSNPNVADELPEVNDCADQQCPGDEGYGVADEISGVAGYLTPGNKNRYSWPDQSGATDYQAVRSSSPTFPAGCTLWTTALPHFADPPVPPSGGVFYYLARPLSSCKGSWGQRSGGVERSAICGQESACGNTVDDDADGQTDCADADCGNTAACRVATFSFTDTTADNIATSALTTFFTTAHTGASDYIYFEIVEGPSGAMAWCSINAGFYRTQYLSLAATAGTVQSGAWNKWWRTPATGGAWQGPVTTAHENSYGNDCFGDRTWCSEQFPAQPRNSIFPDRTNNCEAYDLFTGACGASNGQTWQLTIRTAATRLLACGF